MLPIKVKVETVVDAAAQHVWLLYTQPTHIMKWNYAVDDWHCPSAENDLRKGGKMKYRMEAKDGSVGFDFEAIYDEVVNAQKLAYTMADGRQATVSFEELEAARTKVTIVFDAENVNPVDMQQTGWQAILNNFKSYAESFSLLR